MRRRATSASTRFVVDADCLPQTIAVVRPGSSRWASRRSGRPRRGSPDGRVLRRAAAVPGGSGGVRDFEAVLTRPTRGAARRGGHGPAGAHTAHARRTSGRRRRRGVGPAVRRAAGFGGPHAAYMAVARRARARAARPPGRGLDRRRGTPPTGWHCRPANSTSAGRRPPATSAPHRCCWPSWPPCTPSITAPSGLRGIARRVHGRRVARRGSARAGARSSHARVLRHRPRRAAPGRARRWSAAAADARRATCGGRRGHGRRRRATRPPHGTVPAACAGVRPARPRRRRRDRGERRRRLPKHCCASAVPHPSGLQCAPFRDRDAALPAPPRATRTSALDRGMIPLGSCTMKLNATTEMEPDHLARFAGSTPSPRGDTARGLPRAHRRARAMAGARSPATPRCRCSPTPGAQGELAGLLAIRAYHRRRRGRGATLPDPVLARTAPTPPPRSWRACGSWWSAATPTARSTSRTCGAKCEEHSDDLAAIMVTYPSTHGVYEEGITDMCALVHRARGPGLHRRRQPQRPASAWPSRGSSAATSRTSICTRRSASPTAGAGPAWARSPWPRTWRRSCPRTRCTRRRPRHRPGQSAAPFGSAGILPITLGVHPHAGADGLAQATEVGHAGRQLRRRRGSPNRSRSSTPASTGWWRTSASSTCGRLTKATGVRVDDVAKRLIDYGFHAPTRQLPGGGTLMVEPTESEDLAELDRFCDAMIAIRARDRRRWRRAAGPRGQPAARGAAHRRRTGLGDGSAPTTARGRVPRRADGGQVLAPGGAGSTRPTGTAISCARALRPRRSPTELGRRSTSLAAQAAPALTPTP